MSYLGNHLDGPRVAGCDVEEQFTSFAATVDAMETDSLASLLHTPGDVQVLQKNPGRRGEMPRSFTNKLDVLCDNLIANFKADIKLALAEAMDGGVDCRSEVVAEIAFSRPPPPIPSIGESDFDEIAHVFSLIDKDGSGEIQKAEFIKSLKENEDVAAFCRRHARLTPLLNPMSFKAAFELVDEDDSNSISELELKSFLLAASKQNTKDATDFSLPHAVKESKELEVPDARIKANLVQAFDAPLRPLPSFAASEVFDEISQVFAMIDKDGSGTLDKSEFIRAFQVEREVVSFCENHPRLAPLLNPLTFKTAFNKIDSDLSGQVGEEELRDFLLRTTSPTSPEVHQDIPHPSNEPAHFEIEEPPTILDMRRCSSKSGGPIRQTTSNGHDGKDMDPSTSNGHDGKDDIRKSRVEVQHGLVDGIPDFKLDEELYDVANFYYMDGYAQAIARSERFINATLAVICLNAMYLGIDSDHNKADMLLDAHWAFIICEYLFCVFFSFEWAVRFAAFEKKRNCLKDGWFKFDSFLVLLMVSETCILPFLMPVISSDSGAPPTGPLRLLRLLRLSRLIRLMRSLPELVVIIKGLFVGTRAVGSFLMMITLLIYAFAIIMHMLLKNEEDVAFYFETLPRCMWTLLLHGTFMLETHTVADKLVEIGEFHTVVAVIILLIFILVAALTVMNMLIGVLCEVVSAVSAGEKEEAAINVMKQTVLLELKKYDDGDGEINEDELNEMMADPSSVQVLQALGIDVMFLQSLQVMSYSSPDCTFPIEALIEQMLMCRGDLHFTVKHMIMQQRLSEWTLRNRLVGLEEKILKTLDDRLRRTNNKR